MVAEITYKQAGDYQIPELGIRIETEPLGKWGRIRRTYLQENRPMLYSDLVLSEKLFPHLLEIQQSAERRMEQMMQALLLKNPAPDKKTDQMGWVQHMNSLRAQAEEIITAELINS